MDAGSCTPPGGQLVNAIARWMDDFPTTIGRDPGAAAASGVLNPFPLSDKTVRATAA